VSASGQSCSPSRGAGWPARNISWSAPSIERSRRLPGHLRLLTRASRRPQAPSRLPLPLDEAPGLLCRGEDGSNPPQPKRPGCSSAWPERALRERDVGGSNPLAPTVSHPFLLVFDYHGAVAYWKSTCSADKVEGVRFVPRRHQLPQLTAFRFWEAPRPSPWRGGFDPCTRHQFAPADGSRRLVYETGRAPCA
jgi:hypothetical protein